jgi:hypothetical protein
MERSPYMELPYIDAHGVEVAADVDTAWRALIAAVGPALGGLGAGWYGRLVGVEPAEAVGEWTPDLVAGTALPGFAVERVEPGALLSLRGRHRYARYRFDFELDAPEPGRSHLWARSWGEFPGIAGFAYRSAVIGSGGHAVVVRRMIRGVARRAARAARTADAAEAGGAQSSVRAREGATLGGSFGILG